jgi:hypothetical protein
MTGEISVGILANQQNRNVTAQLEAIPLEGFRELGHASGSPSAKGSSKQVDKRAEEMLQVNESVNHEHLTAAKRVMSLSVRHTNSFWHSCREVSTRIQRLCCDHTIGFDRNGACVISCCPARVLCAKCSIRIQSASCCCSVL